jgi:hypothetical protein
MMLLKGKENDDDNDDDDGCCCCIFSIWLSFVVVLVVDMLNFIAMTKTTPKIVREVRSLRLDSFCLIE